MQVGISTACLFPMMTEQALERILQLGCKVAEVFVNTPSEATPSFACALKRIADAAGAKIVSIHPCSSEYEGASFFGRYPRRFDDALDDYKRYFEMCAVTGAEYIAFHGARTFFNIEPSVYFERFGRISVAARAAGVHMCHENVSRFFGGDVCIIRAMRAALPEAEFLLDIKQAVRAGIDPFEMLDAMGDSVRHVHVSDHTAMRDCMVPGSGDFDFVKLRDRLTKLDYRGCIIIELYRKDFQGEEQLAESQRALSRIFFA